MVESLWSFRRDGRPVERAGLAIRVGFVALFASQVVGVLMVKATHAVTMHAVLLLPALAWLLSFTDWSEQRRVRAVAVAAVGYAALAAVVALQNVLTQ
jgi:hypothetical protein